MQNCKIRVFNMCSLTDFIEFLKNIIFNVINLCNYHGLQWEAGMISYSMARHLITLAVVGTENDDAFIYVKGYKKRE